MILLNSEKRLLKRSLSCYTNISLNVFGLGGIGVFVSFFFLLLLGSTMLAFFLLPARWRAGVLLIASYVFCAHIEPRALFILLGVSVFAYFIAIFIEKFQNRNDKGKSKKLMAAAVGGCVLFLCIFKYTGYLFGRLGAADRVPESILSKFLMPVGLSFYLFQVIGYLVDVYKRESPAEKNFFYLGCYLAFFPKLVSGPIEREDQFLPQMKEMEKVKFWDRGRLSAAFTYMLWGYFMKMVVADRLGGIVEPLFDHPETFDSFWLLLGALFYTIQIYCDFAGYSYIAVGCAKLFGIDLKQNFRAPYMAVNIQDFWRRWHVSLSEWLRDYIYIPLGGNRKGIIRKNLNTMAVFVVCGMWHGAGLNFLAWGLLHGFYSVAGSCLGEWRKRREKKTGHSRAEYIYVKRIITFWLVAFAWIFFRSGSLRSALSYVYQMLTAGFYPSRWIQIMESLNLHAIELWIIGVSSLVIWLMDWICVRENMHLPVLVQQKTNGIRYLIFYLLFMAIFIFGIYGAGYHTEQFIYMQF